MLALWYADPDALRKQIRETRALTSKPFGVNLNLEFPQDERLEVCLAEKVPIIHFFWREAGALLVRRAKEAGAIVLHTVASVHMARRAVESGVDVVVAQG
jgi:NAD(P)H-dependent flavin oxidoreductase YrpB (nitropropane dioxygenase family)